MNKIFIITVLMSMAFFFNNCKNKQADQTATNVQDTAAIKTEIEQILKIQEDAYAQHNEEGNKIMQSTCEDSLLYVGTDGGIIKSSYGYAHDLADGWIERPHNKTFRFYKNTVIISAIGKGFYVNNNDTIFINNRTTKVFVKENNQWKMALTNSSPLEVSYFKPSNINCNPVLLAKYVGVYQREPKLADTISLVNGKLYGRSSSESQKIELFPLNDSTFMAEGYIEKMIFGIGVNGKVAHYTLEFHDGQRVHNPKVK
jgi:hypothetical protein